jgi:hypothetical protein
VDELVDEFAVTLFPAAPVAATALAFTCHGVFRSLRDFALRSLRSRPCVRSIPKP